MQNLKEKLRFNCAWPTHSPIKVGAKKAQLACSIGIAIYPNDSTHAEELITIADKNMYLDKAAK